MKKFVGLHKITNYDLEAIKYGIARDGYYNLFDKLEYIIKGKTSIRELKDEVIKITSNVSNEKIVENKMYYKMCLSNLKSTSDNSIAVAIAIVSILISVFSQLLEQVINVVLKSPEIVSESDMDKVYELLINNLSETTITLSFFFIFLLIVLSIGVFVSSYKSKKKRDSIIYYEFMYHCMGIVEERRKYNHQVNN